MSSRPRLLIVTTSNQRRGAEVNAERLAEALGGRGWDVECVSLTAEPTGPTIDANPLTNTSPDRLRRFDLSVLAALNRRIRRGYDLVLANGSATLRYTVGAGRPATRRRRIGYVSIGEPLYWATTPMQRRRQRILLRSVGWIVAVSQATADQLHELGGGSLDTDVVHGGVPPSFLDVDRPPRSGPLHLVVIGSLSPEKDPEAAVEAVARSGLGAGVRLRFVGAGPLGDQVQSLAHSLGIADRVELVGPRLDIRGDLAWAHALLLTSRTEGLPGVVLEAAAAGRPVLAFDVGGTREIVDDGATGRLVSGRDRAALAEAIVELEGNEPVRQRWGNAGREMVQRSFLLDHAAGRLDQVLRRHLD
jgi:glycosyltransferase involved in cell wall biosynthesis